MFTLIIYSMFLKHHVDSNCYCKHTVEIKMLDLVKTSVNMATTTIV